MFKKSKGKAKKGTPKKETAAYPKKKTSDGYSEEIIVLKPKKDDDDDEEETKNRRTPDEENELKVYTEKRNERLDKKRRRRVRVVAAFLVAFAALFIYVNWSSLAPEQLAENIKMIVGDFGQNKYPVEFEDGTLSAAVPVGSNVGVLTDTSFIIFSKNGEKLDTRPHGINNPNAVFGGGKALIYDRGGKSFKVESRYNENYSGTTDFNITSASMSQNGYFAVVTSSDNYLGEVKVYNNSYKEVFKWDSVQGRIVATALSPDGKNLAAVLIGVRDGNMFSDIYIYNIYSNKPVATKKYDDTLLFSVNFTDASHISAVGDHKAVFLDTSGKESSVFDYGEKELEKSSNTGDTPVLAFKKGTTQTEIYSFDQKGKKRGNTTVTAADIKSLAYNNGKIVFLSGDNLYYFGTDCVKPQKKEINGDTKSTFVLNDSAYVFRTQSVERQILK